MARNTASGPRPIIYLALLTFAVAFAAWRIVTMAFAEHYAGTDPQRALEWRSDHPGALLRLADRRVAEGRLEEAESLARRALAANPLDGRGYRVLGHVAGLQGDHKRQQEMMDLAVRHAPRDVAARAWAAQIALERKDAAAAIRHYDRMLRVAPGQQRAVFPVLVGLASIPEARASLVATLDTRPPWRLAFLRRAADDMPDEAGVAALFNGLRGQGGLNPEENAAFIGRFVKDRRWDQAFVAWASGLSTQELAAVTAPMNGDFERPSPSSGPFDWMIVPRRGVVAGIQLRPDGSGQALHVEFQGQRSEFRDVRQLLLLPAGQGYRLEWRSRLENLETPRGLRWTLTCAGGSGGRLLATEAEAGTRPWQLHSAAFDVPPDCPAQWLTLELDARIPAETQARGTAWFDDVRVVSPRVS